MNHGYVISVTLSFLVIDLNHGRLIPDLQYNVLQNLKDLIILITNFKMICSVFQQKHSIRKIIFDFPF